MIFGNKKTIGFDFLGKSGKFINMNVYVNSINISYQDNSYYIYPLILNLKREIKLFAENTLSLKEEFLDRDLSELYNLLYLDGLNIYDSSIKFRDILYYDLSVKKAFFYAYQEMDDLIIFGKFFEQGELISTRLEKKEYINVLNKLLSNIEVLSDIKI